MVRAKVNGVFLDTNVLLDYCLGREADCADCTGLIGQLMRADIVALVCSASLKDLFYG